MGSRRRAWLGAALAVGLSACATTSNRPRVAVPISAEYVFPEAPADLASPDLRERHRRAWGLLQMGDLEGSGREFTSILKQAPTFYPAETALGFVDLASRDDRDALMRFDRALKASPAYAPALVGRGQALLALTRDEEALRSFEAAVVADPGLADVKRRIEVLAFRRTQEAVTVARRAAESGRLDEARDAYMRAVAASPESPFLLRELATVERRRGDLPAALEHFRMAAALDPTDAGSQIQIGELLEARGDLDGALRAFTTARAMEPSADLDRRIEGMRAEAALSRLPAAFRAIGRAGQITRGDLAALLGVKLEALLQRATSRRAQLITDASGHWASPWILAVTGARVMDPFPNHTFQPSTPIQRGDLAAAVSRVLDIVANEHPGDRPPWLGARPRLSDVDPAHLGYPAASAAVAAGVLPLLEAGAFGLARPVNGSEALEAVDRLAALAGGSWMGRDRQP